MKKILAIMALVMLVSAMPVESAMWDLQKILTGVQKLPGDGLWLPDDGYLSFGDSKDASIGYDSDSGILDISGQNVTITIPLITSMVDTNWWTADGDYKVVQVAEVHAVAQDTASPNTGRVVLKKCNSTYTAAQGEALHTALYLNSTINTVRRATLTSNSTIKNMEFGDRLALDFTGTMTTFAGGCMTVTLQKV